MTEGTAAGIDEGLLRISKLLKCDDVRAAIELGQAFLRQFPENPQGWRLLGIGYLRQENITEADRCLSQAMRAAPADVTSINALGVVRMKQAAYEEAIGLFSRTLTMQPNDGEALSNLAVAFTIRQQPRQAAGYLGRLIRVLPFSAQAFKRAADNHLALGEVEEAVQYGRKAVRLAPQYAAGRLSLADALEARGRFKQAKFEYLAVLEEEPRHPVALAGLLAVKETSVPESYVSSARHLLDGTALRDPDRVQLHLAMAQYFDQRGRYASAFEHLKAGNAIRFKNHAFDSNAHSHAVDRLIDTFSASTLAAFPSREPRSAKPIFIVGLPRSGTTLVEQILATHPRVAAGGELPTIIAIAGQVGDGKTTYPEAMRGVGLATLTSLAGQYLEKLATIAPGARRVTDKMPFNFMHLGLIVALFPDATIIHCRRDTLDTCLSCYFTSFNEQLQFASDLHALGRYCLDYRRLMQHWSAVMPVRMLDLQYERLVTKTEESVRELLTFCELEWDPRCLRFYETDRGVRTPSRWQVRQPIYRQSVGRWRNYASFLQPLRDVLSEPVLR